MQSDRDTLFATYAYLMMLFWAQEAAKATTTVAYINAGERWKFYYDRLTNKYDVVVPNN